MIINSQQNEKIKKLVKLREAAAERNKQQLFIIEGKREIKLAVASKIEIVELFYCQELIREQGEFFNLTEKKLTEVAKRVFEKISLRQNPDGFLALAKIKQLSLINLKLTANPLIIILEAIEKPGNLGAILRSADAAGVDAVIINDQKTDIYNPNVIRASQGTVFTVPVVITSREQTISWCKQNKIRTLAASPEANKEYSEENFKNASAIVMGTEDKGLSEQWLKKADEKIKIKMRGKIDSLNVSVSTAIILFEAIRQRREQLTITN